MVKETRMSNLIHVNVDCGSIYEVEINNLKSSIVHYCRDQSIGLHFLNALSNSKVAKSITFQLSDNDGIYYCEFFMEPIVYTQDGTPLLDPIIRDLRKLYGLIKKILQENFVKKVELRFSYVEVDDVDYEIFETTVEKMQRSILKKYLSECGFPVIKVVVVR